LGVARVFTLAPAGTPNDGVDLGSANGSGLRGDFAACGLPNQPNPAWGELVRVFSIKECKVCA